jgi:WD40 repeat protein
LQVRVWDWKKHVVTNCFAATGGQRDAMHAPPVTELAFINLCESNLLLVGGADGCVRIWHNYAQRCVPYRDEKVANRDTKVWHGATENGP